MANVTLKYFDTHEYIKKSKELGANAEQLAEYQINQIEQAIEAAVKFVKEDIKAKDLATKGDVRESELRLQKEIKSLEVKLMTLYGGGFLILLGVLAKGFHWI